MIHAKKGHYLWTIKDNQKQVKREIDCCIDLCRESRRLRIAQRKDVGHGRREIRRCFVVPAPNRLKKTWMGIQQMGIIERVRISQKTGKTSTERAYFITSLNSSPAILLKLNRSHWAIENILHRTKDVLFHEDASTIKMHSAPHNMASLRASALTFLKNLHGSFTENIEHFQRYPKQLLKILG